MCFQRFTIVIPAVPKCFQRFTIVIPTVPKCFQRFPMCFQRFTIVIPAVPKCLQRFTIVIPAVPKCFQRFPKCFQHSSMRYFSMLYGDESLKYGFKHSSGRNYAAVDVACKPLCAGFTNCCTLGFPLSFVSVFASGTRPIRKTQQG